MADNIIRKIPIPGDLTIYIYEGSDPASGGYIAIKHDQPVDGLKGEVLTAPSYIPDLVAGLTRAAIELSVSSAAAAAAQLLSEE